MHGLYLLWWVQERHIPPPIVAGILAAGDLAVTLLEIPTGWFADRFGHRLSLIVGSLVQVAGMLCCWLGQGVSGVLAASLLVAWGMLQIRADQAPKLYSIVRSSIAITSSRKSRRRHDRSARRDGRPGARWRSDCREVGFGAGWFVETALCAVGLIIARAMVAAGARGGERRVGGCRDAASGGFTTPRVLLGAARVDHAGCAARWRGGSRDLLGADDW
jgi:MFS family permease